MAEIKKGTTSVTRYVMIVDSSDGSPELDVDVTTLDMQYTRYGAAPTGKVDAAAHGAIDDAWDDGEMFQVDKLASPGLYRADWPDAAFVTGVEGVILVISGSGFAPAVEDITLVDNVVGDALDASDRVDVGTWIGTAVTLGNGAPDVNIASTDDIDLSATQKTSVNTEVDNGIETYNLDHLLAVADADDVIDNSVIARLAASGATADWSTFVQTTDSLQAIRDKQTNIETDTAVIGALGAGLSAVPWNSAWDTEVQSEVDDGLKALGLDHLLAASVTGTDVTDNSIIAKLVSKESTADWDDFVNTTDSLQALRDNQSPPNRIFSGTSTASSTTSKVYVQSGDTPTGGADDDYNNTIIAVWRGSSKSTARVNVRSITDYDDSDPSFTLNSVLGFTPQNGDLVEVYLSDTGSLGLLDRLTTGFGTASPDTLEAYLRAIMSKAATAPTSAGTYDPATDSLEYLGEQSALITGSGFSTSTDSLVEIRDAIDTLVAPSVVGASALSGSGFLSDCVTLIRRMTDEPSLVPKYTDADIVGQLTSAMSTVMAELHINSDHNILCRFDITLVSGQQTYILPPNVSEIWAVRKMSTTTPVRPVYEIWSDNHWSSHQSGFVIEGNEFRLLTDWRSTDVLEILYVPNGESLMHLGTAQAAAAGTITLATTVTDGTMDTRANAYSGYMCRILSDTNLYVQERIIDSYVNTTKVATLTTSWSPTPTGTIIYEVLPTYSTTIQDAACMNAAMDILANEGKTKRLQALERRYLVKIRALRQLVSKKASRFGGHATSDTVDNDDRGDYSGWLM